jgi:hypothetical protein
LIKWMGVVTASMHHSPRPLHLLPLRSPKAMLCKYLQ